MGRIAGAVGGSAWFRLMPCWSGYRGTPNVRVRNHRNLTSSIPPPAGGEATCLRRRKPLLFGDIAVMLDAGGTQPRHADAVEHALPCRQFLGTHAISLTRLAGREQARQSVVQGKSVSVRVDTGGRRIIKQKNSNKTQRRTK